MFGGMHPDIYWQEESFEEELRQGMQNWKKSQALKSHGDRTNTFPAANGQQEMSLLITNPFL